MTHELSELFADAPDNWGRWGEDDEIGAINYLDADAVLRGVSAVERGEVYSLGLPIAGDDEDPVSPSRTPTRHFMQLDRGHYEAGKATAMSGLQVSDDVVEMCLHGTTHVDALAHTWYGDHLYNGVDAGTTKGGLEHASVRPIAEHGIVGRGVLLDVARYRGVDTLDRGERIPLSELEACADAQGVTIEPRSPLLVRTGWLEGYYADSESEEDWFDGPGITYSRELIEWFDEHEIAIYATDTIANEQVVSDSVGMMLPLHGVFHRDLGLPMLEMLNLAEFGAACAADGTYEFLFVAAPLKLTRATGSPVNPLAIK